MVLVGLFVRLVVCLVWLFRLSFRLRLFQFADLFCVLLMFFVSRVFTPSTMRITILYQPSQRSLHHKGGDTLLHVFCFDARVKFKVARRGSLLSKGSLLSSARLAYRTYTAQTPHYRTNNHKRLLCAKCPLGLH